MSKIDAQFLNQQVPLVDLAAQYAAIETDVNKAIADVLRQTGFILGQEVGLFEEEFAAFSEKLITDADEFAKESALITMCLQFPVYDIFNHRIH